MKVGYYIMIFSVIFFCALGLNELFKIIFLNDVFLFFRLDSIPASQQNVFVNEEEGVLKINFSFVIDNVNYFDTFVYNKEKIEAEYPKIRSEPIRVCYNKLFPTFNYVKGFKNSNNRFFALSIYSFFSIFFFLGSKRFRAKMINN